jgi:hypothetical protein
VTGLNPKWLDRLGEKKKRFALTAAGQKFLYQFLFKKGEHLFIIGNTGSGKTQKGYAIVKWMTYIKETIVWLDTGKNQEILPLLTMGVPVRIICPKRTSVELQEYDEDLKKWGPLKDPPEIVQVPEAGSAWWAVRKDKINIFCFRNAFADNNSRGIWMAELFDTLATWTRKGTMPKIYPMSLFGDEAHWFNAGRRVSGDKVRAKLSEAVTERALEIRGSGGRLIFFAQNYKNITPASRENLNCTLMCRNAHVTSAENASLSKYNYFTTTWEPKHGLFVFSDGTICPKTGPWSWPFYPMPRMRMRYVGDYDRPSKMEMQEQEIEQELIPDLGKYSCIVQDLQGFEIPHIVSRWEGRLDEDLSNE